MENDNKFNTENMDAIKCDEKNEHQSSFQIEREKSDATKTLVLQRQQRPERKVPVEELEDEYRKAWFSRYD